MTGTTTSSSDARRAFVSVRDEGPGTDQGLAFVRRIVESHGGAVAFDTREGRGTTVRIELAIVEREADG